MVREVSVFLQFILLGVIIGVLFDLFRISRRVVKTYNFIVYIEDVLFWLLSGILILITAFYTNAGTLRGYMFVGIIIGMSLYFLIFSNFIVKIFAKLISLVLELIKNIILFILKPFKFLIGILYKVIEKIKLKYRLRRGVNGQENT